MNNRPFNPVSNKLFNGSFNSFWLVINAFILAGVMAVAAPPICAQTATWRYVVTSSGGKSYLNNEIKVMANRNKRAWEKVVAADGSSLVALSEWDCQNKRRRTRAVTAYRTDRTSAGTRKRVTVWDEVIPGSMADLHYRRVCLPAPIVKWAKMIEPNTALRLLPGERSPITRVAKRSERFEIVPESGLGGWFNIVDAATQEDYWLTGDAFKTVTDASAAPKPAAAKKKLPKPRRADKRARKN